MSIFSTKTEATGELPESGMLLASSSMMVRYSFAASRDPRFGDAEAPSFDVSSSIGMAKNSFSARSRIWRTASGLMSATRSTQWGFCARASATTVLNIASTILFRLSFPTSSRKRIWSFSWQNGSEKSSVVLASSSTSEMIDLFPDDKEYLEYGSYAADETRHIPCRG